MLLGRTQNTDSMTNVCLPLLHWNFYVFFEASKTLCNIWWCMADLYSKGQIHWRASGWICDSIQCSHSFYLFCSPALPVPSRLRVDVFNERNLHPLCQVNRCLFSDVLVTFVSVLHFTTYSAFGCLRFSCQRLADWNLRPDIVALLGDTLSTSEAPYGQENVTLYILGICFSHFAKLIS